MKAFDPRIFTYVFLGVMSENGTNRACKSMAF